MRDQLDGDTCDVWSETNRRAAKEHICQCCGVVIKKGQRYVVVASIFDGYVTTEKKCLACDRAITEFAAAPGHMRWMPSGFVEVLDECILEAESPEEARAWRPMRRALSKRIRRQVKPQHPKES